MSGFPQSDTLQTYNAISRLLHWLMAFLVLIMLALGWSFEFIHGEIKPFLVELHKSLGIAILTLFFIRLGVRILLPPPPHPAYMPLPMKFAADTAHVLLYVLLMALPLSGWLALSAMGRPPSFFGFLTMPALMEKTPELVALLRSIHANGAIILAVIGVFHGGAALFHHVVLKDNTLKRMWPPRRT